MPNFAAMEESWANNKLDAYLAFLDAEDHFVDWCDSMDYDYEADGVRELYEAEMEARAEDAAIDRAEARAEDARWESHWA